MTQSIAFDHLSVIRKGLTRHFHNLGTSGNALFAFTITYKHPKSSFCLDGKELCGYPPNKLLPALNAIYIGLCKKLVHEHNFSRPAYRSLMPVLHAVAEQDGSSELHHHGVIAVKSSIVSRAEEFIGEGTLVPFHQIAKTSKLVPIWGLEGWMRYMYKSNSLWHETVTFQPKCFIKPAALDNQLEVVQ